VIELPVQLKLPWPPSVNGYWRTVGKGQILSKDARDYHKRAAEKLAEQLPLGDAPLWPDGIEFETHVLLCPKDKRRRDVDNWTKGIYDAMTMAKVWEDDDQIRKHTVEFGEKRNPGLVIITLKPFIPKPLGIFAA
jgi:crossover junction endodeoxyribonuclease RusA